jgi:hypothetical protein
MSAARRSLTPKEAVAKFDKGDVLWLHMGDVISRLGLTADEFLPFLQSGEITAWGTIDKPADLLVRSDEVVQLMATHGLHFVRKSS